MRARRTSFAGAPVALRRLGYERLAYLAQTPGRVSSKRELLREVRGYHAEGATRKVRHEREILSTTAAGRPKSAPTPRWQSASLHCSPGTRGLPQAGHVMIASVLTPIA